MARSDGTGTNPGLGCVGCHGREQDAGHDGISGGRGAGLRQHHFVTGTTLCADCHADADPANYVPVGEDVSPPYYGTADSRVDVPCNPVASGNVNENWTVGDFVGLDNDGDGSADLADVDCGIAAETDCFDGTDNDLDGAADCADTDCDGATDGACDTGLPGVCSAGTRTCGGGQEQCAQDRQPGTEGPAGDPTCSDGEDNDCDGSTDAADPDCTSGTEADCFDGLDNDGDGLFDCSDPDCDGASNGPCDTGELGVCAEGTLGCAGGQRVCSRNSDPSPEGNDFGNCDDGLDNDCDGATDSGDTGCVAAGEVECFDGLDNDGDGAIDCADSDCEGAQDGACETGLPGICSDGTTACANGGPACRQNAEAQPEGNMYDNCQDGLDNDCDGLTDLDDGDCVSMEADVWLSRLSAQRRTRIRFGESDTVRVQAIAEADTKPQAATVTLVGDGYDPTGLEVVIDPDSMTLDVAPGGGGTRFSFTPVITCLSTGSYTINWTARVDAPENRVTTGDVQNDPTTVICSVQKGRRGDRTGREALPPNVRSRRR